MERQYAEQLAQQPEPEDALLVPIEEYDEEKLRQQLPIYLLSFAKTYNLENHQLIPDFAAIEEFLSLRYNFWIDDVDHDDVLRHN